MPHLQEGGGILEGRPLQVGPKRFRTCIWPRPSRRPLKRAAKRLAKAAVRRLPGSKLKEALLAIARVTAFDPVATVHVADAMVVASWFMLREAEIASARLEDIVKEREVAVTIPLRKTAQGGQTELT